MYQILLKSLGIPVYGQVIKELEKTINSML